MTTRSSSRRIRSEIGAIVALMIVAAASGNSPAQTPVAESPASTWATLRGRITFEGEPPPNPTIDQKRDVIRDAQILALRDGPIYSSPRLLVDPATGGVRDAIVFLLDPSAARKEAIEAARKPVPFRFDRGVFEPHVLAVMAGTEIAVFTTDLISCNLRLSMIKTDFTVRRDAQPEVSKAGEQFNLLLNAGNSFTIVPELPRPAGRRIPGEVCDDVHPWNHAFWQVLDHPYFAVTDGEGSFTIDDVPAGPQRIVVWHERTGWATPRDGTPIVIDPARPRNFRLAIRPEQIR